MEYEEMQLIWNDQTEERMFAIDEAALHAAIRRKGAKAGRLVGLLEWIMIGTNLVVALVLTVDALRDGGPTFQYGIAAAYFAYSVVALIRRLLRRQKLVDFDQSLRGDLDKAIWHTDYLIRQSRSLIFWYLLPLLFIIAISTYFVNQAYWVVVLMIVLLPATYYGSRWEINKFYLPKKRELEALKEQLLAADA